MKELVRQWAVPWLVRRATAEVARCVHYGAFRYGRGEVNPYENYVMQLASGGDLKKAQSRFVEFLQHYRPADFGEALGTTLSRPHPLWHFPWSSEPIKGNCTPGWLEDPKDAPDILTYFSARGILRTRIEEEFMWLESAFTSIRRHGYQPARFGGHILARKLVASDGNVMYLILDGNHRLSALSALGHQTVAVRYRWRMTVKETSMRRWPNVRNGKYSMEDARRVFRAYFEGNGHSRTTGVAAALVDSDETLSEDSVSHSG